MGAKVWRRDGAGGGTATATQHITRGHHSSHPLPLGKRKLVWRRDAGVDQPPEGSSAGLVHGAAPVPHEENGTRGGGDEPSAKRKKTDSGQVPPMPSGAKSVPNLASGANARRRHSEAAAGPYTAEGDGRTKPDELLKRQAELEALKRKIEAHRKAVEDATVRHCWCPSMSAVQVHCCP
jgi:hypothetical protein